MEAQSPPAQRSPAAGATLDHARALAQAYARQVRERFGNRVREVWLYGSAARGDWTRESDVDVLVLLHREEPGDMEWLVGAACRMGLAATGLLLQPVMLTTAEFDRLAARERRFALDILREGIAA
jgi:predicted nucleotidyltransferase